MPETKSGFNGEYRFLSNFYPSQIEFEGRTYPTVEHAYQAAKTNVDYMRVTIASLPSAADAKKAGRSVILREDWEDIKLAVMKRLLEKKFRDPMLRASLINTVNTRLVEYNYWHDNFWGICNCMRCARFGSPNRVGNHLGKLLMEVREDLINRHHVPD